MKIYRHCFSHTELHSEALPLADTFNSLGFVTRDGSRIAWNDNDSSFIQQIPIRYNLDTKNQVYQNLPLRKVQGETDKSEFFDYCYTHLSNGSDEHPSVDSSYHSYIPWELPLHLIFIPLKGNGFYLNICQDSHSDYIPSSYTTLPVLHPYGQVDSAYGSFFLNLIGLSPSKQINNWVYLYFANWYYIGTTSHGNTNYIDFGDGKTITCPFFSDISSYSALTNITQYVNINQNICNLIRMPYDTEYVNNLYLLVTAPGQVKPGTFFSFGGRNFLNIISNYVVELPSD